ncbi:hypothetical protein ACVGWB_08345, partial [Enterobacter mori]
MAKKKPGGGGGLPGVHLRTLVCGGIPSAPPAILKTTHSFWAKKYKPTTPLKNIATKLLKLHQNSRKKKPKNQKKKKKKPLT